MISQKFLNANVLHGIRIIALQIIWWTIISANVPVVNFAQSSISETQLIKVKLKLRSLGFWVESDDSSIDDSLYYSTIAFQRVALMKNTGVLTSLELTQILKAHPLKPRQKGSFHIEIDLTRKILYLVSSRGKVDYVLPVAIGNNKIFMRNKKKQIARTPRGFFSIGRKMEGWRRSDLGNMFYPSYFSGGIAIHGTERLKINGFTFGCVAIPKFAAVLFSRLTPSGTTILIY